MPDHLVKQVGGEMVFEQVLDQVKERNIDWKIETAGERAREREEREREHVSFLRLRYIYSLSSNIAHN